MHKVHCIEKIYEQLPEVCGEFLQRWTGKEKVLIRNPWGKLLSRYLKPTSSRYGNRFHYLITVKKLLQVRLGSNLDFYQNWTILKWAPSAVFIECCGERVHFAVVHDMTPKLCGRNIHLLFLSLLGFFQCIQMILSPPESDVESSKEKKFKFWQRCLRWKLSESTHKEN